MRKPTNTILILAVFVRLAGAQSYNITTIAGTTTIQDGIPASQAFLRYPIGVQVDSQGNIYVLDQADLRVRRIDPKGMISTVVGSGISALALDSSLASI